MNPLINEDPPMFKGKEQNAYLIQVCRESLCASSKVECLPDKKMEVINYLMEEPENYLFHLANEEEAVSPIDNVIEPDFSANKG